MSAIKQVSQKGAKKEQKEATSNERRAAGANTITACHMLQQPARGWR